MIKVEGMIKVATFLVLGRKGDLKALCQCPESIYELQVRPARV